MESYGDIATCAAVDSGLVYVRRLFPSSTHVYEVKRGGESYVLKVTPIKSRLRVKSLKNESRILTLAKDLEGITHLVNDYGGVGGFYGILKEYFEGQSLLELGIRISDEKLKEYLRAVFQKLHSLHIARLDPEEKNIVVSSDCTKARLVDLDHSETFFKFSQYNPFSDFRQQKSRDLRMLEMLFD